MAECNPNLPNARSPEPHDYERIDTEYGSLGSGGSYDVLVCRNCGRRAYDPLPD